MKRRPLISNERGSAVIEFALVSPLVILLILGALQLGMVLRANAGLRELAGWGGRRAVISYQIVSDNDTIGAATLKSLIQNEAKSRKYNLEGGTLTVTVTNQADTALLTVNRMRLQLTYNYPLSLPFISTKSIPLSADRTFYVPNASTV